MREFYSVSLDAANERVLLINPYFAPTHKVKKALKRAIDRGVDVQIMIPSKSDIPFTPDAAYNEVNKLRKRGATVYLYDGGFHHSKIMMVDDKFCTVGSTNLDSRSLRYDYELNVVIFDKSTTGELVTMFENDVKDSRLLTDEVWKERSWWRKFVGKIASMLSFCL
jgi:cardiolipin synthase